MGLINEENKNKNLNGPQATSKGPNADTLQLGYFSICRLAEEKTLAIHSHF